MRYYVFTLGSLPGTVPHILAEVVDDGAADADRELTLARTLAGPMSTVATREELIAGEAGLAAIEAWEGRDDSEFDAETTALLRDKDPKRPKLRLVAPYEG